MDRIRIWFKNEEASMYMKNVTNWEFEGDYLMIGSMEDENVQNN